MDLGEWLLSQIGDDEERLDRLTSDDLFADGPAPDDRGDRAAAGSLRPGIDVGFLLADCDAKRRIVFEHRPVNLALSYPLCATCLDHVATDDEGAWAVGKAWPCQTLRLLALAYAGREGYLDEWRDHGSDGDGQTEESDDWRDESG